MHSPEKEPSITSKAQPSNYKTQNDCSANKSSNPDLAIISLLDYLEVIAKNWRMIVRVTVIAAILAIIYSLSLPNIYTATTRILPPQQDNSGLMGMLTVYAGGGMGGVAADLLGKSTPTDMYIGILNSEAISDKIIDRFRLMELFEEKYRFQTYKLLESKVDIAAGKKGGIISISVEDKDPKLAAAMANAYVEELGKLIVKLNITGAGQTKVFLEDRIAKAKVDLAKAEEALKSFQKKNKALDITEQTKGTIKGVADLEGQLATEEIKLAGLRSVLTDSTQEVKDQRTVVGNVKAQIAKLEGSRSNASILGVSSIPDLGQQYLRLMREFKVQETIVEMLTKQFEMTKISESNETTSLQIIQTAREPDLKSKPKRSLIILVTTFAAVFGAIFYAFIREACDRLTPEYRERLAKIRRMLYSGPHI